MPQDPLCRESRALIAAARKTGCIVDARSVPGTRYTLRTGESEVRLVQKEQVYYKIKNPFAKAHLKKHPAEYVLFEHVVHNALFPDCRLEFLGVAEDLQYVKWRGYTPGVYKMCIRLTAGLGSGIIWIMKNNVAWHVETVGRHRTQPRDR